MAKDTMRTFRAPDDLWKRLKTYADGRGVSVSQVIRDALEAYLKRRS